VIGGVICTLALAWGAAWQEGDVDMTALHLDTHVAFEVTYTQAPGDWRSNSGAASATTDRSAVVLDI
jgi:hypothetical protein